MKPKIIKLKNGAHLIYIHDARNNYSAVEAGFIAGHASNPANGVAHFMEHMLFKGTKTKNAEQFNEAKEAIVPSLNAYTSKNLMMVTFTRTNALFDKAMELVGEMLTANKLDKKEIENEKGVIKEEYRMRVDHSSRDLSFVHTGTLSQSQLTDEQILGSPDDIDAINLKLLDNFKNSNYFAQNFIAAYCGNLCELRVKNAFNKYFVARLKSRPDYQTKVIDIKVDKTPDLTVRTNTEQLIKMRLSFVMNVPYLEGKRRYENRCIAEFLNKNKSSLFNTLRNKGLVYTVNATSRYMFDTKLLNITLTTGKDKLSRCLNEVAREINAIAGGKITAADLDTIKANLKYKADEEVRGAKSEMYDAALDEYVNEGKGSIYTITKHQRLKAMKQITLEEVNAYAKKLFNKNNPPYVTIMGKAKKSELPTYAQILETLYKK